MQLVVCATKEELGRRAAADGAELIRAAIRERGTAQIVVPAGASQLEMLAHLVQSPGIDWSCVTAFHLDEYLDMPMSHPASFRRFVKERIVERLPRPLAVCHYVNGETDAAAECRRLGELISAAAIDVAFVGIGENGHLAFNDPPADFETPQPYIVVELDEACRRQQLGEGWFPTLADVPRRAITMSIRQILRSTHIICSVPDRRKAEAARAALEGPVTPQVPASALRQHPATVIYLEPDSASLLNGQ